MGGRHRSRQDENSRADDGADAEHDQIKGADGLLEFCFFFCLKQFDG